MSEIVNEPTMTARMAARRKHGFSLKKFQAFFHIAAVGNWQSVVNEMRVAFSKADIEPLCCVLGTTDDVKWVRSLGMSVIYHSTNVEEFETPTLKALWDWCRANPDGSVLYCHTKGASWPLSDIHAAWRRLMVASVVAPCRLILPRLQIADIMGVCWEDSPDYPHFSGNFWMARADWIIELDDPVNYQNLNGPTFFSYGWRRMSAEMWIGSKPWHHVESLSCRNFTLWTDCILFDIDFPGSDYQRLRNILSRVEAYGSDSLQLFGGTFEGGGRLQQNPREFSRFLLYLQRRFPRGIEKYLEIGSAAGCSIRAINDIVGLDEVVAMDLGIHPAFPLFEENTKGIEQLELFQGDSHSPQAKEFLASRTFDLVGIDADHSYEGVKADWGLVIGQLRPGTLVWFHDTSWCEGVRSFLAEISSQHKTVFATDSAGGVPNTLGIRVVEVAQA